MYGFFLLKSVDIAGLKPEGSLAVLNYRESIMVELYVKVNTRTGHLVYGPAIKVFAQVHIQKPC